MFDRQRQLNYQEFLKSEDLRKKPGFYCTSNRGLPVVQIYMYNNLKDSEVNTEIHHVKYLSHCNSSFQN